MKKNPDDKDMQNLQTRHCANRIFHICSSKFKELFASVIGACLVCFITDIYGLCDITGIFIGVTNAF